jgi:hypothetical protein
MSNPADHLSAADQTVGVKGRRNFGLHDLGETTGLCRLSGFD